MQIVNPIESIESCRSFVEEKRGKRVTGCYCKNPRGCKGVVVMAEDANSSEAVCSLCATTFCAACDLPPHAPATCDMVALWEEKGGYLETGKAEDAEARKMKHLTTKPCPRCGVRIEKNGGCPVSNYIINILILLFYYSACNNNENDCVCLRMYVCST